MIPKSGWGRSFWRAFVSLIVSAHIVWPDRHFLGGPIVLWLWIAWAFCFIAARERP